MVAGTGPQPAVGMIVGEAPSIKDNEVGVPFSDAAGRILDVVLRSCGVDRDLIYITNVVKVVPLDNLGRVRRPTPDEVAQWRPILEEEEQMTAPRAILALGQTAQRALTGIDVLIPGGSKIGHVYTAWHPARAGCELYGDWTARKDDFVADKGAWLEQVKPWAEALVG